MAEAIRMTVVTPVPLHAALKELAQADRRPLMTYVNLVLEKHVAEQTKPRKSK